MGTEITLDVGGVAVTYSKNHRGIDHGSIFQEQDRKAIRSDQINYEWYEKNDENPESHEMAFTRRLRHVAPRLELLGFNLERVRREYGVIASEWKGEELYLHEGEERTPPIEPMSFIEFMNFAIAHPIGSLDDTFVSPSSGHESAAQIQVRFKGKGIERIPAYGLSSSPSFSEREFFMRLINILHPYSVLRVLAEAEANRDAAVVWQYGPLAEAGWAAEREFFPNARRTETFLIATEGSSDVHILRHALALLRPEVADFFRFIDVSESHPFSGTGSLVKFAEGLAKIDVHNQVLIVFDNDAEGLEAHQRLSTLMLPVNMRSVMLPQLEEFCSFPTQGPEGVHHTDINRRAAAIECYLDLNAGNHPPAKIRWTNYKKNLDTYQGALEFKEGYCKQFLKQTRDSLDRGTYDVRKIEAVLDYLIAECVAIAVDQFDPTDVEPLNLF
ncbi:HEPN/Toprim-associated domain-containing protein [Micromonospora aurantiaca]|uniref:HEPN/Toprim-associated domain-containing protein n=1 Tax=Micromonospora aurantiaca (nom. illeg.) TaxID=47850 RepID=UPI003796E10E